MTKDSPPQPLPRMHGPSIHLCVYVCTGYGCRIGVFGCVKLTSDELTSVGETACRELFLNTVVHILFNKLL